MTPMANVTILAYTPNPEVVVVAAARTSFKEYGASIAYNKLKNVSDAEKIKNDIRELIKHNHLSPIEHVSFTFALEGVSRSLTHQLVRHRIASYTQQSQRYVKVDTASQDWFVLPPTYDTEEKRLKFIERMRKIASWYEDDIKNGVSKEDARFLLPNATKTNIVVTMNARELLHFFNLRCCARCQWELRGIATEVLKQVKRVAPTIFENAGPSCMKGVCPEGDLMPDECRKIGIPNIQKRFKELR
jgi:thymidylate synthase (FAD)